MLVRRAAHLAVCLVMAVTLAPAAGGDPNTPAPPDAPPPPEGYVASSPPATLTTPDGWTLALGAKDEKQVPVPPLTTAISSREYLRAGYTSRRWPDRDRRKGSSRWVTRSAVEST